MGIQHSFLLSNIFLHQISISSISGSNSNIFICLPPTWDKIIQFDFLHIFSIWLNLWFNSTTQFGPSVFLSVFNPRIPESSSCLTSKAAPQSDSEEAEDVKLSSTSEEGAETKGGDRFGGTQKPTKIEGLGIDSCCF